MMNLHSKKAKRIMAAAVCVILIVAMVLPMLTMF